MQLSNPMTHDQFLCTPPVARGQCAVHIGDARADELFQSTPPRFREAMRYGDFTAGHLLPVSIHAPRFREAMPAGRQQHRHPRHVSIHAPRFREAMQDADCRLDAG